MSNLAGQKVTLADLQKLLRNMQHDRVITQRSMSGNFEIISEAANSALCESAMDDLLVLAKAYLISPANSLTFSDTEKFRVEKQNFRIVAG